MSDVVNVDDDDDVVVVVEVRSLDVSDVTATSAKLSWSLGDTRHVDVVQINQTQIDPESVSVYNASRNTSHTATRLSAGTEYEFYVQVQSDDKTARTDATRVTTGATPTDDHPSSLGLFSVSK